MKRVVLIEDQTAVREMVSQIVESENGFEIAAQSGNGQEAIDLLERERPDFVILDIMLPGLNGTEILRRIQRNLRGARVLIFSGYQSPLLVRDLIQAGAHGFVEKSAPLSELRKGIHEVANGGTYFGPNVARILREAIASPATASEPSLELLTPRERQILQLIAQSYSTKEVAKKLEISVKTAENHRTNLMRKLNLHDVASLTRFAIAHGLVENFQPVTETAPPFPVR